MGILKNINEREGKTIIMVTHDASLAQAYANRTVTLLDGMIVDQRTEGHA
jgi:ABC-type lipoprotein export system ATPase subunit